MGLAVPVDTAHPLLEAGRVPREVVVDHEPAELEVDTLSGSVRSDEVVGAAIARRATEELDLPLTLPVVHAAMD